MSDQEKTPLLDRCEAIIVDDHLEYTCDSPESRDEMAKVLAEEAVIRVKLRVLQPVED